MPIQLVILALWTLLDVITTKSLSVPERDALIRAVTKAVTSKE